MNKKFLQALIASMIITIFSMSLFQPIASASAATNEAESMMDTTYEIETIKETEEVQIAPQSLPPRPPQKDPFWVTFMLVLAGFIGLSAAETVTSNAINNGIDWACDKYDHYTGIKQACKLVQD